MTTEQFDNDWDAHSILQVKKGASRAEVHRAWRRMQKMVHPDRGDSSEREMRTEASARVNRAWYRLRDQFKNGGQTGTTAPRPGTRPQPSPNAGPHAGTHHDTREESRRYRGRSQGGRSGRQSWDDQWNSQEARQARADAEAAQRERQRRREAREAGAPNPTESRDPGTITIIARTIMSVSFFIVAFASAASLSWSMIEHGLRTGAWMTATGIVAPSVVLLVTMGLLFNRYIRNMNWSDGLLNLGFSSFWGTATGTVLALVATFGPRFF